MFSENLTKHNSKTHKYQIYKNKKDSKNSNSNIFSHRKRYGNISSDQRKQYHLFHFLFIYVTSFHQKFPQNITTHIITSHLDERRAAILMKV